MTHHHEPNSNLSDSQFSSGPHCDRCGSDLSFVAYIIGAAVLVGAMLISGSLIYGFNKISKSTVGTAVTNPPAAPVPGGGQQPAGGPVTVTERADAPVLGNKNAKVTIVEFSDFQCPFCQKFHEQTLPEIKKNYIDTGKAKLVYRHFPLSFHVNAQKAAEAGECANRQGKFWEYHDLLFKNGQSDGVGLDVVSLKKYATQLGLSAGKFNQCLDNGETAEVVKNDMAAGSAAGVTGTPAFNINTQMVIGAQPFSVFSSAIDAALKK